VLALPLCGDGSGFADRGGGAGRGCVCRLLGDLMHAGMRFPTGACTTATAPAPELWTKKGRNDRCSVYNVVVCDRGSLFVGKNKSRHLLCGWAKLENCKIMKSWHCQWMVKLFQVWSYYMYVAQHIIKRDGFLPCYWGSEGVDQWILGLSYVQQKRKIR
jgi:hypothetical protein